MPAHGLGGARATSLLVAHFALRNTASNSAEKKGSPRLRLSATDGQASEGVAEGRGLGGGIPPRPSRSEAFPPFGIKTSKQNNFQILLRKIWRAGVKNLKENCFALLAEVRRAETRSGANQTFFVQSRFELRSVIATNQDILKIQRRLKCLYWSGRRESNSDYTHPKRA